MPWLHSAVALLVCCVLILKKNSHSILLTVTIVFSIDSEDVSNPYLHVRRNGILVGHQKHRVPQHWPNSIRPERPPNDLRRSGWNLTLLLARFVQCLAHIVLTGIIALCRYKVSTFDYSWSIGFLGLKFATTWKRRGTFREPWLT